MRPTAALLLICLSQAGTAHAEGDGIPLDLPGITTKATESTPEQTTAETITADQLASLRRAVASKSLQDEPELIELFRKVLLEHPRALTRLVIREHAVRSEAGWDEAYTSRMTLASRPTLTRREAAAVVGPLIMRAALTEEDTPLANLAHRLGEHRRWLELEEIVLMKIADMKQRDFSQAMLNLLETRANGAEAAANARVEQIFYLYAQDRQDEDAPDKGLLDFLPGFGGE